MRALRDLLGGRDGAKLGAMPSDTPPPPPEPSQPPPPSSGAEPSPSAPASGNAAGKQTVLVVDDEPAVRDALRRSLSFEGYATQLAADGAEALEKVAEHQPDLVVLDVLMPRMDGLTAARRLRAAGQRVPVLMLTARDTVGDRVTGLDAGADDYLVKPFELDELLARVRALLRRSSYARAQAQAEAAEEPETLAFADLRMDLLTREVTRGGRPVELTRTEYTLLEMFLAHPRQVLTREQILKAVWGFDFEPSSNSLDVYVMYLRRKTEAGGEPRLVHTVRGVGYVLRDDT
ncbi:response regulator transcription factor [Streptomyces sp. NPDC007083]|uniref:response regulator transcription factor n=1 Tax=Streptomyces sp. NPDC007083 TaxID=3156913 RepID=UPI0033CAE550